MGLSVPASSPDNLPFFGMYLEFMSGHLGLKGISACYYSGSVNFQSPEYQMVLMTVVFLLMIFFFRCRHARTYWLEGQSLDDPYDMSIPFEDYKLRAKVGALLAARDANHDGFVDVAEDIEKVEIDIKQRTMHRLPDDHEDQPNMLRRSKSFVHAVLFSETYGLVRSISLSVQEQFANIDTDKNGAISFAEYQNHMRNENMTEVQLRELFDKMDHNGDRTISPAEFDRSMPTSKPSFMCSLVRLAHFIFYLILLLLLGYWIYLVTKPADKDWPNHTPKFSGSTVEYHHIALIYLKIFAVPQVLILFYLQLFRSMVLETETQTYLKWVKIGTPDTYPYNLLWKVKEFGGSLMVKLIIWITGLIIYGKGLAHDTSAIHASFSNVTEIGLSWSFFSILVMHMFYTAFAGLRSKFQQIMRNETEEKRLMRRLPAAASEEEAGGEDDGFAAGAGGAMMSLLKDRRSCWSADTGGHCGVQRAGAAQCAVGNRDDLEGAGGASDGFAGGAGGGGGEDIQEDNATDMHKEPSILVPREWSTLGDLFASASLEGGKHKPGNVESIPGAIPEEDNQGSGVLISNENAVYPERPDDNVQEVTKLSALRAFPKRHGDSRVGKAQSLEESGIDASFHPTLLSAGLDWETLLMGADDRSYLASELEKSGITRPGDRIKILNILRRNL